MMSPTAQKYVTWIARGLTLAYMGLIVVLSLIPGKDLPLNNISDKYRHAAAYGVFALLIGCSFVRLRLRSALFAFCFASLFGIGIEFVQPSFGRSGDVYDALANAIGASVGCGLLVAVVLTLSSRRRHALA